MKLLVLSLALLFSGCNVGCVVQFKTTSKPDCYCDGPIINGVCDGVTICNVNDPHWCPLDGGACRR